MELGLGLSAAALAYVAFGFKAFGFLARDELLLRTLMLAGTSCYILYYFIAADAPLWDLIVTNGVLAAVNLAMIAVVLSERTTFAMSNEMARLYKLFPLLTPGQFRQLIRVAEWVGVDDTTTIIRQGDQPPDLFFVIEGPVEIEKNAEIVPVSPGIFIGEIAFLTGQPATATVRVGKGATVLRWQTDRLEKVMRRAPNLRAALLGHLNMDLAGKVASSQPRKAAE